MQGVGDPAVRNDERSVMNHKHEIKENRKKMPMSQRYSIQSTTKFVFCEEHS